MAHDGRGATLPLLAGSTWRDAAAQVRRGFELTRIDPAAYVVAVSLFAVPSLVAGFLNVAFDVHPLWHRALILGLPWLTIVLGAAVLMVVVGRHGQGRRIGLGRATWEGLRWVPRYMWTNAHTTVLFWSPMGLLVALRSGQESQLPIGGAAGAGLWLLWWLAIAALALYIHCRTLLAPFLAVHADLPGTTAVVEAWRLSGRNFSRCFATFVLGTLPAALPLAVMAGSLLLLMDPASRSRAFDVAPDLAWVGVHAVRPVLVPAVYALYKELWHGELERRAVDGAPPLPGPAAVLLALTRPLPKLGAW